MDDYLSTSAFQLRRALDDISRGVRETVYDAPKRYQQGGVGEVVFGSPAWEALQVASQARVPVPVSVRAPRADGGGLPYFAQGNDDVDAALRIASQPKVRYDEGPQPGEATLTSREVPLNERVSSYLMGDSRPTPERRRVAESVGNLVGFLPPDPYAAAGDAVQQFGAGHPIDAFETMFGAMPQTGMLKGYQRQLTPMGLYSHAAEAAANLPQAKGTYEQMMAMLRKQGVRDEELRWAGVQEALGNKPVVTQEELAKHFHEKLPQLQETTLSDKALPVSGEDMQLASQAVSRIDPRFVRPQVAPNGAIDVGSITSSDILHWERQGVINSREADALRTASGLAPNRGAPKFGEYVLPGGENYREVVLQHPGAGYQSGHWGGIDSPVAHLRMTDRTGPDGEKILHIEELQSDWAKEGQKKGFAAAVPHEAIAAAKDKVSSASDAFRNHLSSMGLTPAEMDSAMAQVRGERIPSWVLGDPRNEHYATDFIDAAREYDELSGVKKVPSAPYVAGGKNDWLDLALKRALREAAAGGYDKMVWTPGEAQAARYDLSKHIDAVSYDPYGKSLIGTKNGKNVLIESEVEKSDLEKYLGKDIANNLLSAEKDISGGYNLSGLDLRTGGEGMKTFYDKVVPSQLSKILKKLDPEVKVGAGEIPLHDVEVKQAYVKDAWGKPIDHGNRGWYLAGNDVPPEFRDVGFPSEELARQALQSIKGHGVHSIPITPRMREAIMKGLPAYAAGGAVTDPVEDALRLAASHRGTKK